MAIPASRETAVAAIAAVRAMLKGFPSRQNMHTRAGSLLSDVGHGDCACEACCGERARRRARVERLRERFPV